MRMELIENLLQLLVTFVGALLSGISYRKSGRQAYFLLLCFYGCFALGALYWTLYLLCLLYTSGIVVGHDAAVLDERRLIIGVRRHTLEHIERVVLVVDLLLLVERAELCLLYTSRCV